MPVTDYFLSKYEEPEPNYIKFKEIIMTIRNYNKEQYDLVYFLITNKVSNQTYSNIDIMGKNINTNEPEESLATFYKRSNETFGITEILTNSTYLNKMKLKAVFDDNPEESYYYSEGLSLRWTLRINIYIDKVFLLHLYDTEKLPLFLFKIIREDCMPPLWYQKNIDFNDIEVSNSILSNTINKTYKRELFDYQKKNVSWMIEKEYNIKNNNHFKTCILPNNYYIYNIDSINTRLISNKYGQIVNMDNLENINVMFNGGVLCDTVGLGKTFSMLGLVVESQNIEDYPTLLFCPTRLCAQWCEEIDKTYDLKYKMIRNITQFKKLTLDIIKNYDIIIFSYKFIVGKSYQTLLTDNPNSNILLHNINWNRVILDEGHEYINNSNRKEMNQIKSYLKNIKSNYRWICSGTPFNNKKSFEAIVSYLTNLNMDENVYDINEFKHVFTELCDLLFRKNTKDSVGNQVCIPEPIVTTEFLNMSPIERLIYDSALNNNDKKIELCNHVMVSDEHINILGNKPLTLDEIHEKMTVYYEKKIEKYTKRIPVLENDLNKMLALVNSNDIAETILNTENKLTEIKSKLIECKAKFNIFNNIESKINNEDCPICMEDLSSLTQTITPCGHLFCSNCINELTNHNHNKKIKCAMCRHTYNVSETVIVKKNNIDTDEPKLGTKIMHLVKTLQDIISKDANSKIIVFSQWDNMLKLIAKILDDFSISNIFINGSLNIVSSKIRKFKLQNDINVVLMSSDKSPSGLHLTEASTIILLDTLNTSKEESKMIETQAIGRAVRIGQKNNVIVKRFIMRNTIEHDFYIRNIGID